MKRPAYERFVVRVWHCDGGEPSRVSGLVEGVANGNIHRFDTFETMVTILQWSLTARPGPRVHGAIDAK